MEFLFQYGLFLAKVVTFIIGALFLIAGVMVVVSKEKELLQARLKVKNLNEKYRQMAETLRENFGETKKITDLLHKTKNDSEQTVLPSVTLKKKNNKQVFVIEFKGDLRASAVAGLREEITAVLTVAKPKDEVVVIVESPGGSVSAYGLAASQLARLRQRKITLTVAVDKVAASGGYLMACVANKIIAAPFAMVGSIGVVAQLPNFYRVLKKHDVDMEIMTAGEFKRTMTMLGENTEKARKKMQEELEVIHAYFKEFIQQYRPQVEMTKVATGEYWLAAHAVSLGLIDELQTSDDYLLGLSHSANLFQIKYRKKKTLSDKIKQSVEALADLPHRTLPMRDADFYG